MQIMSTTLVTPATFLPVTLEEIKLHLRVDGDDEDDLLEVYIPAAVAMCQQQINSSIMLQTWRLTLERFEDSVRLLNAPIQAIDAITYVDVNGATQTLDSGDYVLTGDTVTPTDQWPEVKAGPGAVQITYKAGFSAGNEVAQQAAVPAAIKSWLMLTVGTMYANRESILAGVSVASIQGQFVDRLLDPYRVF